MSEMRKWKYDTAHPARRCGHGHCSDCKTRRGRNAGNRNLRRSVKAALAAARKLVRGA